MGKRSKKRNPALDYLVYLVVRSLVCVIQAVPLACGYLAAAALARVAYRVDRRHRQVALDNLRHAFGERYTERQRRAMVRGVYEHFLKVIVEIAFIPRRLHRTNWNRFVTMEGAEPVVRAIMGDRPVMVLTAHFGNWEMAGYLLAAIGLKSFAIARDLDNPYLDRFVRRFREWSGQTILSKNGDIDKIQRVLAERGILITVGDQSAGPRGYFVDFFGRPASTHKSIALLSLRYDAPIVVGYGYRDGAGFHFRVGCRRILDPRDYEGNRDAARAITADFTRLLEETIRAAPSQYLWLHNRWKHLPKPTLVPAAPAAAAPAPGEGPGDAPVAA